MAPVERPQVADRLREIAARAGAAIDRAAGLCNAVAESQRECRRMRSRSAVLRDVRRLRSTPELEPFECGAPGARWRHVHSDRPVRGLRLLPAPSAAANPAPRVEPLAAAAPELACARVFEARNIVVASRDAGATTWTVREIGTRALPRAPRARCLVFVNHLSVRRVWSYPPDWVRLDDAELLAVAGLSASGA